MIRRGRSSAATNSSSVVRGGELLVRVRRDELRGRLRLAVPDRDAEAVIGDVEREVRRPSRRGRSCRTAQRHSRLHHRVLHRLRQLLQTRPRRPRRGRCSARGGPRLTSDWKSPMACARTSTPKPNCSSGIGDVAPRSAGELEEHAVVAAAFVQLAGRVEEARAVAARRGDAQLARDRLADRGELLVARDRLAEVLASARRSRPASRCASSVAIASVSRHCTRLPGRAAAPVIVPFSVNSASSALRVVLRLLHVRLIERIHAEERAGDRGGELPDEERLAEVERIFEDDDRRRDVRRRRARAGARVVVASPRRRTATNSRSLPYSFGAERRLAGDRARCPSLPCPCSRR